MRRGSGASAANAGTARFLAGHRKAIRRAWMDRLLQSWSGDVRSKQRLLLREQRENGDLLSALIRRMSGKAIARGTPGLESVTGRARGTVFFAEDLLQEALCLEDAIAEALRQSGDVSVQQLGEALQGVRLELAHAMTAVLRESTRVYEHIVKSGLRGFCQFDAKGVIVATNAEMDRLLGTPSAVGQPLASFLDPEGRRLVRKVLGDPCPERRLMRMRFVRPGGEVQHVGCELSSIAFHERERGAYLCAVDLTEPARMESEIYENFPLGVIRLNVNGDFVYMNPVALASMGIERWDGLNVREILPDAQNTRTVMAELSRRRKGMSDKYRIHVRRQSDGRVFPVMIAAMPEKDLNGRVTGSLAILRDISVELAAEKIHGYICSSAEATNKIRSSNRSPEDVASGNALLSEHATWMLAATSMEIAELLPYDFFVITRFSESMTHLRKFFFVYPGGEMKSYIRWWEISKPLRDGFKRQARGGRAARTEIVEDYEAFLSLPAHRGLESLPEFQWVMAEGFKSSLTHFVAHEGRLLASIALLSKSKRAYREDHARVIADLPLDKVVLTAIQSEQKRAEHFRLELLHEMVKTCDSVGQVAHAVVDGIGKGHLWDHIALYMVDEKEGRFRLLHQLNRGKGSPLPEPFAQPVTAGVLGRVYRTGKHAMILDKSSDRRLRGIDLESVPDMMSELCVPIEIGGKIRWLLNIEDSHQNAFSAEEVNELFALLGEIRNFLDRIWVRHFLLATIEKASDAIFVLNVQGRLENPNEAAAHLLKYAREEMLGLQLGDVVADPDAAAEIAGATSIQAKEVRLKCGNGQELPVLMSVSTLPKEFGGKVLICKDLSLYKRVEELEYLGKMYHEIAVQTQTPLSLAFSWVHALKTRSPDRSAIDTFEKILRQLKKIEITYNRLALYDHDLGVLPFNPVLCRMSEIVSHIQSAFPASETEKIEFRLGEPLPYLKGDLFQLNFCFESILSYLLRHIPPKKCIRFDVAARNDSIAIQIKGLLPNPNDEARQPGQPSPVVSETLARMALGSDLIERFIENHGGSMVRQISDGYEQLFGITLPAHREEALP